MFLKEKTIIYIVLNKRPINNVLLYSKHKIIRKSIIINNKI